jgi:hypothetical protein
MVVPDTRSFSAGGGIDHAYPAIDSDPQPARGVRRPVVRFTRDTALVGTRRGRIANACTDTLATAPWAYRAGRGHRCDRVQARSGG